MTSISYGHANLLHKVPVTANYHQMVYGNITDCNTYVAFVSTDVEEVVSINKENRRWLYM
jgi:hypothetical protein